MIALRRVLFAALLVSSASCGTSVLAVGNPASSDGSVDADADLDAAAACPGGGQLYYDKPGCDGTVVPVCVGVADACAGLFCDCTGHTIHAGCGFSAKPFASYGVCPGSPDSGAP